MRKELSRKKRDICNKFAAGFSLIEIAIVLLIISLIAVAVGSASIGAVEARRYSGTVQNMQKVEDALVSFVSTNSRLPCPADGANTATDATFGLEQRTGSGNTTACTGMTRGVVPWRSLGLTQSDVTDGWLSLFTYRLPLHLAMNGGMTMANCDPAGTGPADVSIGAAPFQQCASTCATLNLPTCTPPLAYLTGKGLTIRNVPKPAAVPAIPVIVLANPAGTPPTGAAFVVVSAGPTKGPAYNSSGVLVPSTAVVGTEEARNQNNQALQAYYVDDDLDVNATTMHYDDIVRRPSVATIIGKANLGPRAH